MLIKIYLNLQKKTHITHSVQQHVCAVVFLLEPLRIAARILLLHPHDRESPQFPVDCD